jgi:nicotinate-nucleotide pyrophosphorylase (carboxylating)
MRLERNPKIKALIKSALREDIGNGDITTSLLFPRDKKIKAVIIADQGGIVCGLNIARMVFKIEHKNIKFVPLVKEGEHIERGQGLAQIYGSASNILSGERVALNFLGLLSGIATRTAQFVERTKKCKVKIMDTRKTLPGLRVLEKYAVRLGGGYNHRFGLDEMVLIKDNHLIASCVLRPASCVKEIIKAIKVKKPKNVKLEIEVKNLKEFKEALMAKPDIIMLDNMKIEDIQKAVAIRRKALRHARRTAQSAKTYKTLLEASGNINLKNIRAYAQTGIDLISLGTLTKDVHSLDLSLEII